MQHDTRLTDQLCSLRLKQEERPKAPAKAPRSRRRLGWLGFGAVLSLCAAAALLVEDPVRAVAGLAEGPAPAVVATAPTAPAPAAVARAPAEVVGSGFVVAERIVVVSSPEGGRLAALPFDVGDRFRAGDLLAEIGAPELAAELAVADARSDRAAAAVVRAEAVLAEARATADRAGRLAERGAGTRTGQEEAGFAVERARLDLELARHDARIATLEVARLKDDLARRRLRAPFDGVVVERLATPGALVPSGMGGGDPLEGGVLRILDPSALKVVVDVAETRIGAIVPGQAATAALDADPSRPLAMRVEAIAPEASVQKGTVAVRLAFEDGAPQHPVLANMAAKVTFAPAADPS